MKEKIISVKLVEDDYGGTMEIIDDTDTVFFRIETGVGKAVINLGNDNVDRLLETLDKWKKGSSLNQRKWRC